MREIKEARVENLAEFLESLSEDEKKQAFMLLQGMIVGKELAEQQPA